MTRWIQSWLAKRGKLQSLRAEHGRAVAHRRALAKLAENKTTLAIALQQMDLHIAAVELEIRQYGAKPPVIREPIKSDWLR